jgi:hypothetical protein
MVASEHRRPGFNSWYYAHLCKEAGLPDKFTRRGGGDVGAQEGLRVHLVVHMHGDVVGIARHPGKLVHQGRLAAACHAHKRWSHL